MFQIYLFKDPEEAEARRELLRQAVCRFAPRIGEEKKEVDGNAAAYFQIEKTEKGKPFFTAAEMSNLCFSISHSGGIWACILGYSPCGLDFQEKNSCRYQALADRFFSGPDADYVRQKGAEGFFEIWTRREALGKYTGQGLFGGNPETVDFSENCRKLKDEVVWKGESVFFRKILTDENFAAVWCCGEEEEEARIVDCR